MKFLAIFVAAVAAVRITDPAGSEAARVAQLKESMDVVAKQQKFEADHFAMHSKNMATAKKEADTLKDKVRAARHDQVTEGNQYPPYKTY